MNVERRMAGATVAAVALHALALLGLALSRPLPPLGEVSGNPTEFIAITLEATGEPPPPRADAPPAPSPPQAGVESTIRARTPITKRRSVEQAPPAHESSAPMEVAEGTAGEPVAISAPAAAGSGPTSNEMPPASAPPDMLPPPLVPRATPVPSAVWGVNPRDKQPPPSSGGGQIIGAVRAVAEKNAPRNGHGTIRVEVDATGAVVRVTSSSPSWANVARSLQASLAGRRLRVPSGARGVLITFAVDADVTNAPPALTGEAKAAPCSKEQKDQAGRAGALPEPGCINALALLPLPRHRVTVRLAGEQVL